MYKIKITYYSDASEDEREFFTQLPIIPQKNDSMTIYCESGGMDLVWVKYIIYNLNKDDVFEYIELIVYD